MTLFHDPSRTRMGERPCWLKALVVIPDVVVEVAEEQAQRFRCRVMVPVASNSCRWAETGLLGLTEVARLLVDWHDEPEQALWTWFKHPEPNSAAWAEGRQSGRQVATKVLISAGDVDPDDLGL